MTKRPPKRDDGIVCRQQDLRGTRIGKDPEGTGIIERMSDGSLVLWVQCANGDFGMAITTEEADRFLSDWKAESWKS